MAKTNPLKRTIKRKVIRKAVKRRPTTSRRIRRKIVKGIVKRILVKKIINSPLGHHLTDIGGADRFGKGRLIKLIFMKKSGLGRLIGLKKLINIPIPKGLRLMSIESRKPRIGQITITFRKR